jgi:hypothetical protein
MMTMSEVPTSTPVPRSVMMRNWCDERLKESGRMPARKELLLLDVHASIVGVNSRRTQWP